jgi:type II secretory pathway component GspD/PulD (secretin)
MNIPLQGAFNKLLEEHSLSYSYEDTSNKLTIFPALTSKRNLIPLRYMLPGEVKEALARFGMIERGVSVKVDVATRSVLVEGPVRAIGEIESTIAKLERGAAERQKGEEAALKMRESDSKLREQAVLTRERELRVKCAEEQAAAQMSRQVEVIPVHYASVGPTTLAFQGKSVSVPGMDETLRILLEDAATANRGGLGKAETSQPSSPLANNCGMIKPILSLDLRTNSIVVQAPPDVIVDVKKMISALDKPMPLIDLEVMIVQAEAGTSRNLGVQWGAAGSNPNGAGNLHAAGISTGGGAGALAAGAASNVASFYGGAKSATTSTLCTTGDTSCINSAINSLSSGGTGSASTISPGSSSSLSITSAGNDQVTVARTESITPITDPITLLPLTGGAGNGLLSYIYQGKRGVLAMQLNALQSKGKSQILASPHVVTLNNVLAKITSTRRLSIPITTGDGTRSDIKSVSAGLEMQITPSVIPADIPGAKQMVRLNINARNSSFTAALETDEKEVQSNVIIPDGATFILGGLFQDTHLESSSGVAGLMDIPLIGGLFRSKTAERGRSETIFFITPKLVDHNTLTAYDVGTREYMYYQKASLEQDRRALQARPGIGRRVVENE